MNTEQQRFIDAMEKLSKAIVGMKADLLVEEIAATREALEGLREDLGKVANGASLMGILGKALGKR